MTASAAGSSSRRGTLLRRQNHLSDLLFSSLSDRSHADLTFVCENKTPLRCHRLVISAQSRHMRRLLLQRQDDKKAVVHLPGVRHRDLNVVVKFLYTGKLVVKKSQVDVIRELLEDVLKVDAKIALPDGGGNKGKDSDRNENGDGSGGGSSGSGSPPEKKRRRRSGGGSGTDEDDGDDLLRTPPSEGFDGGRTAAGATAAEEPADKDDDRQAKLVREHQPEVVTLSDDEQDEVQVTSGEDRATPNMAVKQPPREQNREESEVDPVEDSHRNGDDDDDSAMLIHSVQDGQVCHVCQDFFPDRDSLREHVETAHAVVRVKGEARVISDEVEVEEAGLAEATGDDSAEGDGEDDVEDGDEDDLSSKIHLAPRVISKHPSSSTSSKPKFFARKSTSQPAFPPPPPAPRVITKKTGGKQQSVRDGDGSKRARTNFDVESLLQDDDADGSSSQPPSRTTHAMSDSDDGDDDDNHVDVSVPEQERPDSPQPSTSGMAVARPAATGDVNGNNDDSDEDVSFDSEFLQEILELPPPVPLPPEPGLVIYRGEWVKPSKVERLKAKTQAAKRKDAAKPRPYNYKPFISISGMSKQSTLDRLAQEEDGIHICPYCDDTFRRENSLQSHISRNHHSNLKAECPECHKKLSCEAAIKKHLLSHRPKDQWPYECPLCGVTFQAKGDLPKHLYTKKHEHDRPELGSDEWKDLMRRCVRLQYVNLMNDSFRNAVSVSLPAQVDPAPPLLPETEQQSAPPPPSGVPPPVLQPSVSFLSPAAAAVAPSPSFVAAPNGVAAFPIPPNQVVELELDRADDDGTGRGGGACHPPGQ